MFRYFEPFYINVDALPQAPNMQAAKKW